MFFPWYVKAFIVALGFVPFILGIPLLQKHGLRSESAFAAWAIGYVCFLAVVSPLQTSASVTSFVYPLGLFALVIVAGIVIGGPVNLLMAQAMMEAPNPGFAFAITSLGPAAAYLAGIAIAAIWPDIFPATQFRMIHFCGLVTIAAGVGMLLYR